MISQLRKTLLLLPCKVLAKNIYNSLYSFTDGRNNKDKEQITAGRGFTVNERGQPNRFAIEPKVYIDQTTRTNFTEYAEKLNGRTATIGFV